MEKIDFVKLLAKVFDDKAERILKECADYAVPYVYDSCKILGIEVTEKQKVTLNRYIDQDYFNFFTGEIN